MPTFPLYQLVGTLVIEVETELAVNIDGSGKYLLVAHDGSTGVSVYSIDALTGKLTSVAGSPFPSGTSPFSIDSTFTIK